MDRVDPLSLSYRYQLRYREAEELSDSNWVGSRPHLWFDKGRLTLTAGAPIASTTPEATDVGQKSRPSAARPWLPPEGRNPCEPRS
jgi:hypothetical protein